VNAKTGAAIDIQTGLIGYPVEKYPHLAPPSDGQGFNFGNKQPNYTWATRAGTSGTEVTPIPNWSPTGKIENVSGFTDVTNDNTYASYIAYLKPLSPTPERVFYCPLQKEDVQ